MEDKSINAGKVGLTMGGDWKSSESYEKLTCVSHNGRSWAAKKNVSAGVEPSEANSAFWQLMSDRGVQGIQGPVGPQGNSAFDGTGVEIVNNLTQGGQSAVLSAEQGKVLKTELTELESKKINNNTIHLASVNEATSITIDKSFSKKGVRYNNGAYVENGNGLLIEFPLEEGDMVSIDLTAYTSFFAGFSVRFYNLSDETPKKGDTYPLTLGKSYELVVPKGATMITISTTDITWVNDFVVTIRKKNTIERNQKEIQTLTAVVRENAADFSQRQGVLIDTTHYDYGVNLIAGHSYKIMLLSGDNNGVYIEGDASFKCNFNNNNVWYDFTPKISGRLLTYFAQPVESPIIRIASTTGVYADLSKLKETLEGNSKHITATANNGNTVYAIGDANNFYDVRGDVDIKVSEATGDWIAFVNFENGYKYLSINSDIIISADDYSFGEITGIKIYNNNKVAGSIEFTITHGFKPLMEGIVGKVIQSARGVYKGYQTSILGTIGTAEDGSKEIPVGEGVTIVVNKVLGGQFQIRLRFVGGGFGGWIPVSRGTILIPKTYGGKKVESFVLYKVGDNETGFIDVTASIGLIADIQSALVHTFKANSNALYENVPDVKNALGELTTFTSGEDIQDMTSCEICNGVVTNDGTMVVNTLHTKIDGISKPTLSISKDRGNSWTANRNYYPEQANILYDSINDVIWYWNTTWYKSTDRGETFINTGITHTRKNPLLNKLEELRRAESANPQDVRYAYFYMCKPSPTSGIQLSNGVLALPFIYSIQKYEASKDEGGNYIFDDNGYPVIENPFNVNSVEASCGVVAVVYSVDYGETWIESDCTPMDIVVDESVICEVEDNQIMINSRANLEPWVGANANTNRRVFIQKGECSSNREEYRIEGFVYDSSDNTMHDPMNNASIARFVLNGKKMWLYSNVDNPYGFGYPRNNLTLWVSPDARHWAKCCLLSPRDERIMGYGNLYVDSKNNIYYTYSGYANLGSFIYNLSDYALTKILETYSAMANIFKK